MAHSWRNTAAAAERMCLSVDTIRAAIKSGALRAKRLSDAPQAPYLTTDEWLDEWADSLPDA